MDASAARPTRRQSAAVRPGARCPAYQSKALQEIDAMLDKSGFHEKLPPAGTEVVSWYVMMGIDQP